MSMNMFLVMLTIFYIYMMGTSTSAAPVLDTTGHPLKKGVEYHILPGDGNRGGLSLERHKSKCPLNVCENLMPSAAATGGVPVTLAPLDPKETTIHTSTDFNIAFFTGTNSVCGQTTVWRMGGFEHSTGKWYLAIGGSVGNLGVSNASNWFRLERVGRSYKFVYCPKVCDRCKVVCGDIGVVGGNTRKRLLGLSKVPLKVVFRRKTTESYY